MGGRWKGVASEYLRFSVGEPANRGLSRKRNPYRSWCPHVLSQHRPRVWHGAERGKPCRPDRGEPQRSAINDRDGKGYFHWGGRVYIRTALLGSRLTRG